MDNHRLKKLQASLDNPILIKKKENLLYLIGRSFLHGYLLIKKNEAIFLGDGLERVEGVKTDFLKNVGKYIGRKQTLEVFGEFTYAEVKYIKFKNPKLKIKVTIKYDPVDKLRMIKDPTEIKLVKKSMQIVESVFLLVKKQLINTNRNKRINTEMELADFIKKTGLKLGAEDVSFPPIVASGANAAVPHHVPSNKRLKTGESTIIDFGFKYKNYCSDFTRTVFLKTVPKKLEIAYNQVEKAYNESIEFISSHFVIPESAEGGYPESRNLDSRLRGNDSFVPAGKIYQKSVDVLSEKNLQKYFIHSLGHGTGLEIHELPNLSPNSKDILKNNMVFSIEPGVYLPRVGGIRIEDLVYLEKGMVKKFINVSTSLKNNII